LLIFGIVLSGTYEHLQDFECPVAMWSDASEYRLSEQRQGSKYVTQMKQKFHQIRCGKRGKIKLCLLCFGECMEEG
jgi:hypothetical protein